MKIKKRIYLLQFLFVLYSNLLMAQSQSVADKNLTWFSRQNIEMHSGMTMETEAKIATKGRQTIELTVQGQVMSFKIQTVTGTWENENLDGKLIYAVLYNTVDTGKITIERTSGNPKITIDFTETNADGMHQEFTITSIETN